MQKKLCVTLKGKKKTGETALVNKGEQKKKNTVPMPKA